MTGTPVTAYRHRGDRLVAERRSGVATGDKATDAPLTEVAILVDLELGVIAHGAPGHVENRFKALVNGCRATRQTGEWRKFVMLTLPASAQAADRLSAALRSPMAAQQLVRAYLKNETPVPATGNTAPRH